MTIATLTAGRVAQGLPMSEETKEPSRPRPGIFREARGVAVQSFAGLEQALCTLFADLIFPLSGDRRALRKNDQAAAVIFFNINSMPARLDIISQLMKIKYSGKYVKFWNS